MAIIPETEFVWRHDPTSRLIVDNREARIFRQFFEQLLEIFKFLNVAFQSVSFLTSTAFLSYSQLWNLLACFVDKAYISRRQLFLVHIRSIPLDALLSFCNSITSVVDVRTTSAQEKLLVKECDSSIQTTIPEQKSQFQRILQRI